MGHKKNLLTYKRKKHAQIDNSESHTLLQMYGRAHIMKIFALEKFAFIAIKCK